MFYLKFTIKKTLLFGALACFVLTLFIPTVNVSALEKPDYNLLCTRGFDCSFFDPEFSGGECALGDSTTGGGGGMTGKTNGEKVFNWLVARGIPAAGAAGVVGNLMQESGGRTENLNTRADNGTHRGIAQWDKGGSGNRWGKLLEHSEGKEHDLVKQVEFIWYELTGEEDGKEDADDKDGKGGYNTAYRKIKTATTPEQAAADFERDYERADHAVAERKENARKIFNKYGSGVEASTPQASSLQVCNETDGGAFVSEGYSWPVDIKKAEVRSYAQLPCKSVCHHDKSAAFDLTTKVADDAKGSKDSDAVGRAVYSISDGTISNLKVRKHGGCYSFQFASTKDGFKYWYGHLGKPVVRNGQSVSAGQKVAEIGERKCADDTVPHLHIDRGSPRGEMGGSLGSRDPGIIPLINGLFNKLPE